MTFTPGQRLIYEMVEDWGGRNRNREKKVYLHECVFVKEHSAKMAVVEFVRNRQKRAVLTEKLKEIQ